MDRDRNRGTERARGNLDPFFPWLDGRFSLRFQHHNSVFRLQLLRLPYSA